MIDFETDLRRRLDDAASGLSPAPDLLDTIERRVASQGRRVAALRVAAVVAVLGLAVGGAVALAPGDDAEPATRATDPTEGSVPGDPTATSAPTAGWAEMPEAPIAGRFQHLAVDMAGEVLVWGGYGFDGGLLHDGAVYETGAGTWRPIPEAPLTAGGSAVGVWTGEVAIVVNSRASGPDQQAAAFDPDTDTWTALAEPPPGTSANAVTRAVWTGTEVAITTGASTVDDQILLYDPVADEWRVGATPPSPPPAFGATIWTGSEVLVVGYDAPGDQPSSVNGDTDGDGDLRDPGDPPDLPVSPTAGETIVMAYDPAADTWRSIPWGLEPGRSGMAMTWTGTHLLVVGGGTGGAGQLTDGAQLDPATGAWTPITPAPAEVSGLRRYADTWTGRTALVLGGPDGTLPLEYDPATDAWTQGPARPGDAFVDSPAVWSAGRLVAPLGGEWTVEEDGVAMCCDHGPAGGATYTP